MKYANTLAVRGEKDKKKLDYIREAEEGHFWRRLKNWALICYYSAHHSLNLKPDKKSIFRSDDRRNQLFTVSAWIEFMFFLKWHVGKAIRESFLLKYAIFFKNLLRKWNRLRSFRMIDISDGRLDR